MSKYRMPMQAMILALFISSAAFSQWENENSGVTAILFDVCFVDTLHGWAVGDSATIIATTNGGKTWERQSSPSTEVLLEKVVFVNENEGYILGQIGSFYLPRGRSFVLSTKNGGQFWQFSLGPVDYLLGGISFINADTGWVSGADFQTRRGGVIFHTQDGGQSWQKQLETSSGDQLFTDLAFLNEKDGWVLGGGYVDNFSHTDVYRTSDGGQSWNKVGTAQAYLVQLSVVSADTIWAGGRSFARSLNSGLTWEVRYWPTDSVAVVSDVEQIDGQTGWFVTGSPTGNKIFFTNNGGVTWTDILKGQITGLIALSIADRTHLWTVGLSGIIARYREKPSAVDQARDQLPQTFRLEQNFPNPFNAGTTISFSVDRRQAVTLTIYDIYGRHIAVLLSQILNPGTYSIAWKAKNQNELELSSGIYFYELRAAGFVARKKMVLIR